MYGTEPAARHLAPGDACRVGIPPRIIHVIEVHKDDPPQETGWLPRPSLSLLVLRAGEPPDPRAEFQGTSVEPDDGIPLTLELVFRPYAFLEPGDDVVDADGRAWRFDGCVPAAARDPLADPTVVRVAGYVRISTDEKQAAKGKAGEKAKGSRRASGSLPTTRNGNRRPAPKTSRSQPEVQETWSRRTRRSRARSVR